MKFNEEVSKAEKRHAGHTDVQNTPLEVHSKMKLTRGFKEHVREQIEHALRHNATRVERVEVWFDDLNGPKGGIDTLCRVTLVMGGQPNIFVEETAASAREALDTLTPRLGRVLDKAADRTGHGSPRAGGKTRRSKTESIALADAAARSEAAIVAEPDTTPTEEGNTRKSTAGMTAALERSDTKPSRKSTRRAVNSIKAATPLTSRTKAKVSSPKARHDQAR